MSGGSYDYLCFKDPGELIEDASELARMQDRLAGLGYAKDAAVETAHLLARIRQFSILVEVASERLQEVWKAVEWWDSCDYSEEQVKEALVEYRGGKDTP